MRAAYGRRGVAAGNRPRPRHARPTAIFLLRRSPTAWPTSSPPVANDHILARLIPRARLVLYPDAWHGFLFQEGTPFASLVESFLIGHPGS